MSDLNASRLKLIIFVLLSICIAPIPMSAGDFDGSVPLICATVETFECVDDGDCTKGEASSINLPQFLKIDFKTKTISGAGVGGEGKNTKFESMESAGGKLILQGIQNGKGWSMVITESTGKMTLSASDDQVVFVVFGACTPD